MGAMVASRFHPAIRDFYQRLLSAGKPKKLALTACIRKLLIILNSMLKLHFKTVAIGYSWSRVGFVFPKPLSPMHRSIFLPIQHAATLIFSVDRG